MTPFPTYAETPGAPFSRPFPKLDFWMHFGHPLAPFGLPFGSLWLPFGSPWLPFGTLWLTFGALWLPFGSLLGPFGFHFLILLDFGTLLALFGSLLPPFRLLFLICITFCLRFRYFPNPSAKNREINTCTPTSYRFSHTSIFAGPGRIYCRRQLRSTFFRILKNQPK